MRFTLWAVVGIAMAAATPALAAKHHAASSPTVESMPTFDDCFRLAWVRGVHVERDELGAFNEDCLANKVPFDSGYSATTIKREPSQPSYRVAKYHVDKDPVTKTVAHKPAAQTVEKSDVAPPMTHDDEEMHGSEAGN